MKSAAVCLALFVLIAPGAASAQPAEPTPSPVVSADRLFQAGEFAQAGERYARIVAEHADDCSAILGLARVALLSNHLDTAENWLKRASALRPGDADPKVMLAEVYYRRDDFEKAIALPGNSAYPFYQCLLGMTLDKLGEKEKAMECYRKASTTMAHNPPAAFAKPFTRKKLA